MVAGDVPRGVRVITLLAWLMAPAGLLLAGAGVLNLVWWSSADGQRLAELMGGLQAEYGVNEPAMLRDRDGAITLLVLGAAGLAYAILAPMIRRGHRWARSWALGLAFAVFLIALMGIGADASHPSYLRDYYATLGWTSLRDRIPEVQALIYPSWYQWFEDVAQGLGAITSLAVVVGLSWAAVAHSDYFVGFRFGGGGGDEKEPDEWDAALAKLREEGTGR